MFVSPSHRQVTTYFPHRRNILDSADRVKRGRRRVPTTDRPRLHKRVCGVPESKLVAQTRPVYFVIASAYSAISGGGSSPHINRWQTHHPGLNTFNCNPSSLKLRQIVQHDLNSKLIRLPARISGDPRVEVNAHKGRDFSADNALPYCLRPRPPVSIENPNLLSRMPVVVFS